MHHQVVLLTSVYYRAVRHSFIVDACGPVANLAGGLAALLLLRRRLNIYTFLYLLFTAAFNVSWFAWTGVYAGLVYKGDFAFYFAGNTGVYVWRCAAFAGGICTIWFCLLLLKHVCLLHAALLRTCFTPTIFRRVILTGYLTACAASLVAVACYQPHTAAPYYEALMFPVFFPILLLPRLASHAFAGSSEGLTSLSNRRAEIRWTALASVLFILFCVIMGHGISLHKI